MSDKAYVAHFIYFYTTNSMHYGHLSSCDLITMPVKIRFSGQSVLCHPMYSTIGVHIVHVSSA